MCGTAKVGVVRAIGADNVIDYTRDDFAGGQHQYDVILDVGGNRRLSHLRRALTPTGRLVIVGGETDSRWLGGTDRQLRAAPAVPVRQPQARHVVSSENSHDLVTLRELVESGQVTPVIDRTYPLSDIATAIRYLAEGHARGKVVIA